MEPAACMNERYDHKAATAENGAPPQGDAVDFGGTRSQDFDESELVQEDTETSQAASSVIGKVNAEDGSDDLFMLSPIPCRRDTMMPIPPARADDADPSDVPSQSIASVSKPDPQSKSAADDSPDCTLTASALFYETHGRCDDAMVMQSLHADFSHLCIKMSEQDELNSDEDENDPAHNGVCRTPGQKDVSRSFYWNGSVREQSTTPSPSAEHSLVLSRYSARKAKSGSKKALPPDHSRHLSADTLLLPSSVLSPESTKSFHSNDSPTLLRRARSQEHGNIMQARELELQQFQQQLGASSHAFLEGLRGAAFRRKHKLAQSRDSILAKERAAQELQRSVLRRHASVPLPVAAADEHGVAVKPFAARPVPSGVTEAGRGGVSGVPKVTKRLTTTPFSPLLGARRQLRKLVGRSNSMVGTTITTGEEDSSSIQSKGMFRARPLPKSTFEAGTAGVPKVPRRPVTMPFSPLLGARRPKQPHITSQLQVATELETSSGASVASSTASPFLAGLALVHGDDSLVQEEETQENQPPAATAAASSVESRSTRKSIDDRRVTVASSSPSPTAYLPHSTVRAKQRADFDRRQSVRQQQLVEAEQADRVLRVKALQKELRTLRESL